MEPLSKKEAGIFRERQIQAAADGICEILKSAKGLIGGSKLVEIALTREMQRHPIRFWNDILERVRSDWNGQNT